VERPADTKQTDNHQCGDQINDRKDEEGIKMISVNKIKGT
jgi:hypothetical protein